jgi:hypothetical protein
MQRRPHRRITAGPRSSSTRWGLALTPGHPTATQATSLSNHDHRPPPTTAIWPRRLPHVRVPSLEGNTRESSSRGRIRAGCYFPVAGDAGGCRGREGSGGGGLKDEPLTRKKKRIDKKEEAWLEGGMGCLGTVPPFWLRKTKREQKTILNANTWQIKPFVDHGDKPRT